MRSWAAVTLLALLWTPVPTNAQQRTVTDALSVPDGATCLRGPELAMHVRAWLRRDTVADTVTVLVVDERGDERHDVAFVLLRGDEPVARRTFPVLPEGCADRRAALALAIAIALDSGVLAGLGVPEQAAAYAVADRPAPREPDVVPPPVEAAPAARRWRLALGAHAGGSIGLLPRPAVAGGAAIELREHERFALRVGGAGTAATTLALGSGSAETQLVFARADGCLLLGLDAVVAEGCTSVAFGVMFAEGRDYDLPRSAELNWLAGALRLGGRWPAGSDVALRVGLDGWVSVIRPRLQVHDPAGAVRSQHTLPAAGITGDLGLIVTFL